MIKLNAYKAALLAIKPELDAFKEPVKPRAPAMTAEQHRLFREGGSDALRAAGLSDLAKAKDAYIVAHAKYCSLKEQRGADLRAAKARVGYEAALQECQAEQRAILEKSNRTAVEDASESEAHSTLGALSVRHEREVTKG